MRNIINNISTFFKHKYILALSGFSCLSYYFWFRFIRERLPKDIPFELSLVTTIILIYICILYAYIIYRIIKPSTISYITLTIYKIAAPILMSFIHLNQLFIGNTVINNQFNKLLIKIINNLDTFHLFTKIEYTYICYVLLPKIVLVCIFILDVFWFHKLSHIYLFLFIGIIPLFTSYFIYSIKILQQNYFNILQDYLIEITSEDDDPNTDYYMDPSTITYDDDVLSQYDIRYKYLTIEHFVNFQVSAIMFNDTPYRYRCFHNSKRQDLINLSGTVNIVEINTEYYLSILIDINIILESYQFVRERQIIKNINLMILGIYLISWLYILIVSLPTLTMSENEMYFIANFQELLEPFSQINIYD